MALSLRNKGYTEFLPLYHARHRAARQFRDVQLPLFPGYVFCRFDHLKRLPILMTPSVLLIVSLGPEPARVDEAEMEAIQAVVRSGLEVGPWPFLAAGDLVHIEEGPLRGVDGLLIDLSGKHRLVVSITLLSRSVAVAIDRRWVRPLARLKGPVVTASPLAYQGATSLA